MQVSPQFGVKFAIPHNQFDEVKGNLPLTDDMPVSAWKNNTRTTTIVASSPDNPSVDIPMARVLAAFTKGFLVESSNDESQPVNRFSKASDVAATSDMNALIENVRKGEPTKFEAVG